MAAAEECSRSSSLTWTAIANHLLSNHFLLSALELHLELAEVGKELPELRDFFSNPGNFERPIQLQALPRSASISTFDSIDVSRYSDDGRDEDEKIAVLEYELRRANETIKKLRGSLTSAAEHDGDVTTLSSEEKGNDDNDAMKPYEKRALNFLINEFLMKNGHKLTSVTFSDEIGDQDLDNWDNVGLNTPQPPDMLRLYRDFGNHLIPQLVDDEKRQLLEKRLSSLEAELIAVKRENEMLNRHLKKSDSQLFSMKQELETRDGEIKYLRNAMETTRSQKNEETSLASEVQEVEIRPGDHVITTKEKENDNDEHLDKDEEVKDDTKKDESPPLPPSKKDDDDNQFDETQRQMSTSFRQHLLASVKVVLDSRLGQEVAKLEDSGETPVSVFGRCLHHIYPNVILAKRDELIPVLLCTIQHHPDTNSRDQLLHVMFNLIKKPNREQRQMIMSGCVAFAKYNGPTMVEAELMPQCWEQINHKYVERRLLVAESCGCLAPYLPSELRSSLVLSMLQQMLHFDKSDEVREAATRSLAIIVSFIDDQSKYNQCNDLLVAALKDSSSLVTNAARRILLPSFMAWSFELHWLETKLLASFMHDLKNAIENVLSKLEPDASTIDESPITEKIDLLTEAIPWQVSSLLLSASLSGIDEPPSTVEKMVYPSQELGSLFDISVIVGSEEKVATLHSRFNAFVLGETTKTTWTEWEWFADEFLPEFYRLIQMVDLSMEKTIRSFKHYAIVLCQTLGYPVFSKMIKPYFLTRLTVEKNQESSLAEAGSAYTNSVLPLYIAGILASFQEDRSELVIFLRNTIAMLALHCIPIESLKIAFAELALDSHYHELLIGVLWDLLVDPAFHVRCCAATLFEYLVKGVDFDLVSKRVVPALVTLASDGEMLVRPCTLAAFGSIAETVTERTLLEKIRLQFQSFLDDPIYEDEHAIHLEVVKTLADIGPNVEPKLRDEFILPRLADIAAKNKSSTNETRRRDIAIELIEGFKALSCCFFSMDLLETFMIPGLKSVLVDANELELPDQDVIDKLIREFQSKIDEARKDGGGGESDSDKQAQRPSFFKKFSLTPRSKSMTQSGGGRKRRTTDLFRRKGKDKDS